MPSNGSGARVRRRCGRGARPSARGGLARGRSNPVSKTSGASPFVLIFDGACGICQRSVAWIAARDRGDRIEFLPLQSEEVRERFPSIPRSDFEEAMHLIAPGGRVWTGARAVEEVLRLLPRWRLGAWTFRIPGVRLVAGWVYRMVAGNRHALGCGDHCALEEGLSDSEAH
ncbi:MAG: DUF393 domain-containing protein [Gemmatimonadales bacterium]|nr:MAG: DUF393 domain-containing protein [Gemmatimonadales bacterium]